MAGTGSAVPAGVETYPRFCGGETLQRCRARVNRVKVNLSGMDELTRTTSLFTTVKSSRSPCYRLNHSYLSMQSTRMWPGRSCSSTYMSSSFHSDLVIRPRRCCRPR